MAGNYRSGPTRQTIPGLMPGGMRNGKPVNPLVDACAFEDLKVPDVLDQQGRKFWIDAAKKLCAAGEMCEAHTFGLTSLAYQYQWIVRKEKAGIRISAMERGNFNRMCFEYGLIDRMRRW